MKDQKALVEYLTMEIRYYWRLANIAAQRKNKLITLGDTCAGFHGRAAGLHQALFQIDPETARNLKPEE
jgi:hypothetical protein